MEFDKPITKIDQLYELQDSIEELTLSYDSQSIWRYQI